SPLPCAQPAFDAWIMVEPCAGRGAAVREGGARRVTCFNRRKTGGPTVRNIAVLCRSTGPRGGSSVTAAPQNYLAVVHTQTDRGHGFKRHDPSRGSNQHRGHVRAGNPIRA